MYFSYQEEPLEEYIEVFFDHPDLMNSFLEWKTIPMGIILRMDALR
jgi:hypothetical protein